MVNARQIRGRRTAKDVAGWFRANGFPHAEAREGSAPGRDIMGMLGLAPEIKARADYSPTTWLRQADANAQPRKDFEGRDLPFVVHRPNNYGPARLPEWVVSIRLDDFTNLLRDAGYGDPQ